MALLLSGVAVARAGKDGPPTRSGYEELLVVPEQRRAVDRALAWIASHQKAGGMWGEQNGTRVADTALSVLALMAGGSVVASGAPTETGGVGPETLRGPYAKEVRNGLSYLARLAWADASAGRDRAARGFIEDDQNSRMHGHGFATLALATACGNLGAQSERRIRAQVAGRDPSSLALADQVRWALELAVECSLRAQDRDSGGWGYTPTESVPEGSITVTQIAALRAASDAGVAVDGAVMRQAYDYVRKSQNLVSRSDHGGFAYSLHTPDRVTFGLTSAALTTFFALGRYGADAKDREVIRTGLDYLDRRFDEAYDEGDRAQWFYYNWFYAAQALYQSADEKRIRAQWPRIRALVLEQQQRDGSFRDCGPGQDPGREEYSTAIACLTLQVPMETLPVFQRR